MTGHHESTGPGTALSSDSTCRVTQYQTAGVNARLRLFALLERRACPRARRTTWWPGRSARWWSWTAWRRLLGVCCVRGRLGRRRDGGERGPGGHRGPGLATARRRSGGATELAVHCADVRQRERADLVRLEGFVRESVLPRAHPHTTRGAGCWRCWARPQSVYGADGEQRRGLHPLHARCRALRPGRPTALQGRKARLAEGGCVDLERSGAACIPHAAIEGPRK